jgi:hypothetical protein
LDQNENFTGSVQGDEKHGSRVRYDIEGRLEYDEVFENGKVLKKK